jgi:hypothetical protein
LLWVVGDVGCKDREDFTPLPICAYHRKPIAASFLKGLEENFHAVMEELVNFVRSAVVGKACQFGDRDVTKEDVGSRGGFTAH